MESDAIWCWLSVVKKHTKKNQCNNLKYKIRLTFLFENLFHDFRLWLYKIWYHHAIHCLYTYRLSLATTEFSLHSCMVQTIGHWNLRGIQAICLVAIAPVWVAPVWSKWYTFVFMFCIFSGHLNHIWNCISFQYGTDLSFKFNCCKLFLFHWTHDGRHTLKWSWSWNA